MQTKNAVIKGPFAVVATALFLFTVLGPGRYALAGDLGQADQSFRTFAAQWVNTVGKSYRCTVSKKEVVKTPNGYVARYFHVPDGTLTTRVKTTDRPGCPFVGVLSYHEHVLEATGASPEAALAGDFSPVKRSKITEIFRHDGSRWVH